jgi:hypothetical protein
MRNQLLGICAISLAIPALTASAQEVTADRVTVIRVYDSFGVPGRELRITKESVRAIFASAGVAIEWKSCPLAPVSDPQTAACQERLAANELVLRLLPSPAGKTRGRMTLGDSLVDRQIEGGVLLTVYPALVSEISGGPHGEPRLLAFVIAHEIGHLLLGSTTHPGTGVMRPVWSSEELLRDSPANWRFSAREARQMREHVIVHGKQTEAHEAADTPEQP